MVPTAKATSNTWLAGKGTLPQFGKKAYAHLLKWLELQHIIAQMDESDRPKVMCKARAIRTIQE
jgi:hypothetical protein